MQRRVEYFLSITGADAFRPDVAVGGVVSWRCVDLKALIKQRFAVDLSERSIGRILGQRRFTRLSVRPRHRRADEAAQEAFKKTSPPR